MKVKVNSRQQAGFTLIELMIVVAITSMLAAVALPSMKAYREKATIAVATHTGHQILNAFTSYAATSPGNLYPGAVESIEDVIGIVGKNGSWLTETQLAPFRDPETSAITVSEWCAGCSYPPLECFIYVIVSSAAARGLDNFSLLIPIQSIVRHPDEMLVLEVNSTTGVKIHTGMPEILSSSPI